MCKSNIDIIFFQDGNTTNVVSAVQNSQNQQSYDQTANQQDIPDSQQNGDAGKDWLLLRAVAKGAGGHCSLEQSSLPPRNIFPLKRWGKKSILLPKHLIYQLVFCAG